MLFFRLFAIFNILFVAITAVWSGDPNFEGAFFFGLAVAGTWALVSMIFKTKPVFDE